MIILATLMQDLLNKYKVFLILFYCFLVHATCLRHQKLRSIKVSFKKILTSDPIGARASF